MTSTEAKNIATSVTGKVAGSQRTNILLAAVGVVAMYFGWTTPEQSQAIVASMFGFLLTGFGGFNAARVGHNSKTDEQTNLLIDVIRQQGAQSSLHDGLAEKVGGHSTQLGELVDVAGNLAGHVQAHSQWIQQKDPSFVPPSVEIKRPAGAGLGGVVVVQPAAAVAAGVAPVVPVTDGEEKR